MQKSAKREDLAMCVDNRGSLHAVALGENGGDSAITRLWMRPLMRDVILRSLELDVSRVEGRRRLRDENGIEPEVEPGRIHW